MCIFFVGETLPEEEELLKDMMTALNIPFKTSKHTNNLFVNSSFIKQEIIQNQPKAIVCLGSKSLGIFGVEFEDKMSAVRKQQFHFNDIPMYCTYSPKYLIKQGGEKSRDYLVAQNDVRQWYRENNDNFQEEKLDITVMEADRYLEFINMWLKSERGSIDYEASSLSPLSSDFYLGGIGISDGVKSAYLSICDYANPSGRMTAPQKAKLTQLIRLVNQRKFSAFNLNYEYLSSLSQFGVRMDKCVDVMQLGKALDIRGSLKEQVQLRLGKRGWTNAIDNWLSKLEIVLNCFKPTSTAKGPRDKKEYLLFQEKGIVATIEFIKGKELKNTATISEAIDYIINTSTEIYGTDKPHELLSNWIKYKYEHNDWEIRYVDIPSSMLGYYCALDSCYTYQLQLKYEKELKEKGLEKAGDYYNQHMQFGIKAEIAGFRWDDARAEELKNIYIERAIDALRKFLLLDRTKRILEINPIQEIEILSATSIDVLKKYFNPDSTQPANTEKLSKIITTDKIKMAMMFNHLNVEYQQVDSKIGQICPTLLKLMQNFHKNIPNYVNLVVKAITQANHNGILTLEEKAILGRFSAYSMPDATSETVETMANSCKRYLGVNADKEETWTEDYKLIFYMKLYKKISKAISAFIDGRNGRKSVMIVEREVTNGFHKRVGDYDPLNPILPDHLMYLYEPHYGINSAETRRWTSAFHGLPSNCDVQQCLLPYHDDWIIFKADYSQFELRILALLAKADSLVQAFKAGKDVHRFVASKVFQIPEDEVSDTQRSFAKKAVFGIVFLKTLQAFADDYMHGDIKATQEFFDMFFTMFPEIGGFIEGQKEKLFKLGYIETIFGDPIHINFDRNKKSAVNDAVRYSVNYPIQSSASNIAGLTGNRLTLLAEENNYKFKIPGFIHDCLEPIAPIEEIFIMFDKVIEFSEELPWQEFGAPIQMDMETGVSIGNLVEFKRLKGKTKFYEDGVISAKFDGKVTDCDKLFYKLRKYGMTVDVPEHKEYDKYYSWSDLYVKTNSTFNLNFGTTQKFMSGLITISKPTKLLVYHPESESNFWSTEKEFEKLCASSADGQLCCVIEKNNPNYSVHEAAANDNIPVYGG
jgi:hypothetical protein